MGIRLQAIWDDRDGQ